MPCYLFTYHGHGTWLPDHPRGYVHRNDGLQESDPHMAEHYRANMKDEPVRFTNEVLSLMMEAASAAGGFIDAVIHGCAAEDTHVHVLVSWRHDREWKSMRTSIRSAMSRSLNKAFGKRDWFSDSPSRKRVRDHEHMDYLLLAYLPDHSRSVVREEDQMAAEGRDAQRAVSVRARRRKRKK